MRAWSHLLKQGKHIKAGEQGIDLVVVNYVGAVYFTKSWQGDDDAMMTATSVN